MPNTSIMRPLSGLARVLSRPRNSQDDMSNYFGPGVSIAPIAPPDTQPRGWQYWPFQNQTFTPRPDAVYTAQDLRNLAQYFVARICIENCKDIITSKPRQIRLKKKEGESNKDVDKRGKGDATLKMLNDFFDSPDKEHDWETWLRAWLEDVYVGDWASLYVRRTRGGQPYGLEYIDGAFITKLIDEFGRTPAPPNWAYQQLWSGTPGTVGGIPFVNLTSEELVYWPRNIVPRNTVSSFLYGFSPTEQGAEEIKLGQNRLNMWLLWYTAGVIPDMLHVIPPNITADQLKASQKTLDAEMSGQLQKRAGAIRLVQGFVERGEPGSTGGDQFIQPKEKLLADPFDDMHLRKISFLFGSSAQRLMKQLNRASAQAGQEAAEEEGTEPVANSVRGMVNWVIATIFKLGFDSYELTFDQAEELDAVKRSTADKNDVDSGILTRDEARQKRGMDPVGGDAAKLMITTAQGTTPVDLGEQVKQAKAMADAMPKPEPTGDGGPNPKKKVTKRARPRIDPARTTPDTRQAHARLESALTKVFMRQKEKAGIAAARLLKADDPQKKADDIFAAIQSEFANLPAEAQAALAQAALSGINDAIIQIQISDAGMLSSVNTIAAEYARKRAAEMVGMKYNDDGELIPNPNAKWAISETTRDRLREIVKNAFENKTPMSQIVRDIENADIFSEARAKMIAETEVRTAQVRSNFEVWDKSGYVTKVKWLALGPDPCPICEDNDGEVRKLGEKFPSGAIMPLEHPNCFCILTAVGFSDDKERFPLAMTDWED